MSKPKDDGHVKALMSWNFNNLECSRPLSPDATDEDYRREFEKAIELTQEAIQKLKNLTEDQQHFSELCGEYLYLKKMAEAINKRIEEGRGPANSAEICLVCRLKEMEHYCFCDHVPAWKWEQRLSDAMAESLEKGDNDLPF